MNGIYIVPKDMGNIPENFILIFKLSEHSINQIKEKTKNIKNCEIYATSSTKISLTKIIELFNNQIKLLKIDSEDDVIIKKYFILHHLLKFQPSFDFEAELLFS